jgi:hypothetical protein
MRNTNMEQHYLNSSFREKLIEHLFIGELLKISWQRKNYSLEIATPEVDDQGYDIIAEANGVLRHIQLKAAYSQASTASQKVHMALSAKPSGCIIWVYFNENTLDLGPFLFFGGKAGEALPDISGFKVGKHTKGNAQGKKAQRPKIRVINKGQFTKYDSIHELYDVLFESA